MNLLIHIGIYKTGSSYIQYLCANNKEEMQRQGIFLPSSLYDKEMKRGGVSPGNGHSLSLALRRGDREELLKLLQAWVIDARNNNCHSILISSEFLVHDFADKAALILFESIVDTTQVKKVSVFAFLRDFVDHALSTYKHRAQSGKYQDFDMWIAQEYETPTVLQNLLERMAISNIDWTLRKFEKSTDYIIDAFFSNWLNVSVSNLPAKPKVNESLTLSEVALMATIYKNYPLVNDYFVTALKDIPKEIKANDADLELHYKHLAYQKLVHYEPLIGQLNKFRLGGYNDLKIGDPSHYLASKKQQIILSSAQLEAVLNLYIKFGTVMGKLIILRRIFKQLMPMWALRSWSSLNPQVY